MTDGSNQTYTEDASGTDVKFASGEKSIAVFFRRLLSVSTITVLAVLVAGLFPLLLPLVLLIDFFRRVNFAGVRVLFFLEGFLIMEVLGVMVSAAIWLAELPGRDATRFERRNYALQNWWGTTIATFFPIERIFSASSTSITTLFSEGDIPGPICGAP